MLWTVSFVLLRRDLNTIGKREGLSSPEIESSLSSVFFLENDKCLLLQQI